MSANSDGLTLAPSNDPETRKIGICHVTGRNDAGVELDVDWRTVPASRS